jgi:hypothetical protein
VADGKSAEMLFREFWTDVRSCMAGSMPICTEPTFTYRHWLDRESTTIAQDVAGSSDYWYSQLADSLPFPPSPFPIPSTADRMEPWTTWLDHDLWALVHSFAARRSMTTFTVCLAALGAAIHEVTGRNDVVIHVPYANRSDADELGVVGWLSTMLPIRVRLGRGADFSDVCQAVSESMLHAVQHARLPFPELLRRMQPEHHCRRTPFRIMLGFHYEKTAEEIPPIPHIDVQSIELPVDAAGWGDPGLAIQVYSHSDGAKCTGIYDPSQVAEEDFARVTARFTHVLQQLASRSWDR